MNGTKKMNTKVKLEIKRQKLTRSLRLMYSAILLRPLSMETIPKNKRKISPKKYKVSIKKKKESSTCKTNNNSNRKKEKKINISKYSKIIKMNLKINNNKMIIKLKIIIIMRFRRMKYYLENIFKSNILQGLIRIFNFLSKHLSGINKKTTTY